MRQKLLSGRPVVTRTSRRDPRGAKLESVAAEFALLAQRRARIARQIDLLARQLDAAAASLCGVQSRMGLLAQRMHQIDPDLVRDDDGQAQALPPQAAAPQEPPYRISNKYAVPPRGMPVLQAPAPQAEAPARTAAVLHRPMRHVPRRRPFLPD